MLPVEGSRKRKRISPFRIKTGSIVALRVSGIVKPFDVVVSHSTSNKHRDHGGGQSNNSVDAVHVDFSDKTLHTMVWTNPSPHRDLYWSLIGKRVRCSLPQIEPLNGNDQQEAIKHDGILEGEVIRIRNAAVHRTVGSSIDPRCCPDFHVDLLVDAKSLPPHPLVKAVEYQDYVIMDTSKLKEAARRSIELERQVARGGSHKETHLVVVRVVLQYPIVLDMSTALDSTPALPTGGNNRDSAVDENDEIGGVYVQKWVTQKCVDLRSWSHVEATVPRRVGSLEKKRNDYITSEVCVNGEKHIPGSNKILHMQGPSKAHNDKSGMKRHMEVDAGFGGRDSTVISDGGEDRSMAPMKSLINDMTVSRKALETKKNANVIDCKLTHKKGKPARLQYLGDSNDSQNQQMQNWRWLANRYHDVLVQSSLLSICSGNDATLSFPSKPDSFQAEVLSAGFIGEVLKVDPSADPLKSLAMVTIRRMFLPEHTKTGRMNFHAWNDVFLDHDSTVGVPRYSSLLVVPIEQLIVISRQMPEPRNDGSNSDETFDNAVVRYSYSWTKNVLFAAPQCALSAKSVHYCHRCRRLLDESTGVFFCNTVDYCLTIPRLDTDKPNISWCKMCLDTLEGLSDYEQNVDTANGTLLPCCRGICDCFLCAIASDRYFLGAFGAEVFVSATVESSFTDHLGTIRRIINPLSCSASLIRSFNDSSLMEFSLPPDLLCVESLPYPRSNPATRNVRKSGVSDKSANVDTLGPSAKSRAKKRNLVVGDVDRELSSSILTRDVLLLKRNRCAREIVYKPSKKYSFKSHDGGDVHGEGSTEKPRSLRGIYERSLNLLTEQKDDSTKVSSSSRAARVTQRRLLKDVASFGPVALSYLGLFDTLANREPQLRFDRSKIHAWGVFADAAIPAGELIVEYRGELIGNAVAERREIEYEAAKIGSDYMFRIDSLIVCDATKQGNVARFINASCDPNCYTKIITFDGTKRIVIYAKKDIEAGDELCYDYKFPLEYDEAKRIPCHCRARDCRGYMNWVREVYEFHLRCGYLKMNAHVVF
jgi:[histone H3]-lysine4 N-trimethyltransferase SETD1